MGTRNTTIVQIDGEYKIAQYGQWDGYPGGVGTGILNALSDGFSRETLKGLIREIKPLAKDDLDALWMECGKSMDVFKSRYPHLSRDCAGDALLELIKQGKVAAVRLDLEFPGDSLFCEWCYVVDFDKNVLEVYKGFNTAPLGPDERFANLSGKGGAKGYEPVRLVKSFSLDALPSADEFCKQVDPGDEEE